MRVNVIHPMFLSDQHLVAEYREVKMGPKALSRSLGSLKGVDKKKISPVYTLNTGHTYFFYDKNTFLEKRLAQLVEEMQFRGFQTNHLELLDDGYDYHPKTFDSEWWNDWIPTVEAATINLERINERFFQKSLDPNTRGWYKLFGHSVPDMGTLFKVRKEGFCKICPHCKSIIDILDNNEVTKKDIFCWYCCKKIIDPSINLKRIDFIKREQKEIKEIKDNESDQQKSFIIKQREFTANYKNWADLRLYLDWLVSNKYNIEEELKFFIKFVNNKLNQENNDGFDDSKGQYDYDEFDLEDLAKILKILIQEIANKKEIINLTLELIKSNQDKVFFKEYFKNELE